jgi:hypothetical protein
MGWQAAEEVGAAAIPLHHALFLVLDVSSTLEMGRASDIAAAFYRREEVS